MMVCISLNLASVVENNGKSPLAMDKKMQA
jgi:hypothetical protein